MDEIIHFNWGDIVKALNDTSKEYRDNFIEAILNQTGINLHEFMTEVSGQKLKNKTADLKKDSHGLFVDTLIRHQVIDIGEA